MNSESHIVTEDSPLPGSFLRHIALAGPLDEICNHPGSVRHYIFSRGDRDRKTNKLQNELFFFVYQTGRYGPQNGFRLVLVHRGYRIASATKEGGELEMEEDEIDALEREIPQGHAEVVVLGSAPAIPDEDEYDDGIVFAD